jgi:hypothetical protein
VAISEPPGERDSTARITGCECYIADECHWSSKK